MKRAKRFSLIVQHYGEQAQPLEENIDRPRADRALLENETILRGYKSRVGRVNGEVVVFGKDDRFDTRIWIRES